MPVRKSISSLLTVVVFLVLIAITATLYNGDKEQKENLEQNFFWQKTAAAFNGALSFLIAPGHSSSTDVVIPAPDETPVQNGAVTAIVNSPGTKDFLTAAKDKIKEEWDKSGADDSQVNSNFSVGGNNQLGLLDWQKTATGAEIIFREKNGVEHKLPLPFKFLSR